MYYRDREEQDRAAQNIIDDYRTAASFYPALKEALLSFDQKVYNKRLETSLREKIGRRVYAQKGSKYIFIYYYGELTGEDITLTTINIDDLIDGKRIDAQKAIETATERRAALLKTAAEIEQQMPMIDTVRKQIAQVKAMLSSITGHINYHLKDIYNLNLH